MFARGNYEINDWIGVFGQGMFSHVKTQNLNQGGAIVSGWDVFVPYGSGVYTGSAVPNYARQRQRQRLRQPELGHPQRHAYTAWRRRPGDFTSGI